MDAPSAGLICGLAFLLAFAFGFVVHKTNFCTMGAVSDVVNTGDWTRMRMWLLAIAVAVLGAAALHAGGQIDLGKSIYRTPVVPWLSALVGGGCFGIGMVLASGCGAKTLVRLGGGNLKSLVVFLVMALVASMTLRGIFAGFRVHLLDPVAVRLPGGSDLSSLLTAAGLAPVAAIWLPALLLGGGLAWFCLRSREFRRAEPLLGGLGVGLAVVAAWYVSGHLGYVAEHPDTLQEAFVATASGRMEALTFVAPQAHVLEWLMLWSDTSRTLNFGIATVLGVIAGAAVSALLTRSFRWEGFVGVEDTVSHLLGAALMGFGGVTGLGCTIGQGVSGVSTLAVGSLLTWLAIIGGAVLALKVQYWRLMRDA